MYVALLGRFVSRDPVGYADSVESLYQYVRTNPILAVDPAGLWRFVAGMGRLMVQLGPEADYGSAASSFVLSFLPDREQFRANANGTCCREVRFVQIYYMASPISFNTLPNRQWTIDADLPPYYPHQSHSSNPNVAVSISMFDTPYASAWTFHLYPPGSVWSQDFETCVVCAKSKVSSGAGIGDVFGCVRWGHSFRFQGAFLTRFVDAWRRYVDWDDRCSARGEDADIFLPDLEGRTPSEVMGGFLSRYFR